jgi:hypothetical protein
MMNKSFKDDSCIFFHMKIQEDNKFMSNIFTLENVEGFSQKLNIDELYEKKRQQDVNKLELFNKILNRIHVRIKTISAQRINNQICFFQVPEMIIGVPRFDQGACIAYLMSSLKTNGFQVRYVHPNLLIISWAHWVPGYVREEIKKKTGIVLNEYGEKVPEEIEDEHKPANPNEYLLKQEPSSGSDGKAKGPKKEYTPIKSYKPSGNLVYDDELLSKIEDKFF